MVIFEIEIYVYLLLFVLANFKTRYCNTTFICLLSVMQCKTIKYGDYLQNSAINLFFHMIGGLSVNSPFGTYGCLTILKILALLQFSDCRLHQF
jgi:hypothetical protein